MYSTKIAYDIVMDVKRSLYARRYDQLDNTCLFSISENSYGCFVLVP